MQTFTDTWPTPCAKLNDVLADLVGSAAGILGDNFHAACLQGSFAMGGFDGDSDVDFLLVVNDEIVEAQVNALQVMHQRIHAINCTWAKRLEGSYFPKGVLRDHTLAGSELWYLDNGSKLLVRSSHCNTVVVRCTVRDYGIALAGPAPRLLVDPIPVEVLRKEIIATMCHWGGSLLTDPQKMSSRWYQSFTVVSYCRMLQTLHTGKLWSKQAAVRWGMETLDPCWAALIARAWTQRPNPEIKCQQPTDPVDLKTTISFIQYAINLSHGLSGLERNDATIGVNSLPPHG